MAKTNFNHSKPVAEYVVSETITGYNNYISQPPFGADINAKVFYSYFLPVVAKTGQGFTDPVTFLILKPKNLWLYKDTSSALTDAYGNRVDNIVNYSPAYKVGDTITLRYLIKPITVSDFINKWAITIPSDSGIAAGTNILAEDSNEINRTRIAAPNTSVVTQPVNYTVFSRWL